MMTLLNYRLKVTLSVAIPSFGDLTSSLPPRASCHPSLTLIAGLLLACVCTAGTMVVV